MNLFGSSGGVALLQSRELSRQDRLALMKLGVGRGILEPETEQSLLASEPQMDVEMKDPFKASTFTFKFVAFKTPINLPSDAMTLPSKLFFTLRFFTFR